MDAKRIERLKVERHPKPSRYGFVWSRYWDGGYRIYWRLKLHDGGDTFSVGVVTTLWELQHGEFASHKLWAARYELRRYSALHRMLSHSPNSKTCNPP